MPKILVIDDNEQHRLINRLMLEKYLYEVTEADNAASGLNRILHDKPDCVLLDHCLMGDNGMVMLHELHRDLASPPPVIFLSAVHDESLKRNVMALGAFAFIEKTAANAELLHEVIDAAIAFRTGVTPAKAHTK